MDSVGDLFSSGSRCGEVFFGRCVVFIGEEGRSGRVAKRFTGGFEALAAALAGDDGFVGNSTFTGGFDFAVSPAAGNLGKDGVD